MSLELGTPDPRVRSFVLPTRIVWTSESGVEAPENLLSFGDDGCTLTPPGGDEPVALVLDYGRELHGGIRLQTPQTPKREPATVRIRFGESVSEVMAEPNNDHTPHDYTVPVPWWGHMEVGTTGFRFVRIDLLESEIPVVISEAPAAFIYRPLEYHGSFRCSDERLNEIWEVGAYTVHLCMQDHVWDGIKRDRLVWIGDLHPETKVICDVFGECDVVPSSLDYARDHYPLPGWMNGISSYSIMWLFCHADWYLYHGNRGYLEEQRDYLLGLVDHLVSYVDDQGKERLDGHRFLEWPTSEDPTAIDYGLQALMVLGLECAAQLCEALGETAAARNARETADRARGCQREPTDRKVARALAVLAGMEDALQVNERVFCSDPYRDTSTFYGYYLLEARAKAGDYKGAMDLIRNYWGGMLDMGATTFWEGFSIDWMPDSVPIDELPKEGMRDIHADFGDWCYKGLRHSLCHGWAAGPTAWLIEHVLGLRPTSPGFATMAVEPHLGDLDWAEGSIATPRGPVRVRHERTDSGIDTRVLEKPDGVEIAK
ncbi:MAG: Bacterial alpha-L-rhamnosidase [Armatimonadia bacterium]|nr:Bacterial alpha-L-rhamnosidase [Armatimonadia bacterium]